MRSRLKPCPESPNCVSTQSTDRSHRMLALGFEISSEEAMAAVRRALEDLGARIVEVDEGYLRAEVTTRWFRFVDDVELHIHLDRKRVDYRSASRVGYSDLGTNRRRMRKLARDLMRTHDFFLIEDE